jgi:hypothetical protein
MAAFAGLDILDKAWQLENISIGFVLRIKNLIR